MRGFYQHVTQRTAPQAFSVPQKRREKFVTRKSLRQATTTVVYFSASPQVPELRCGALRRLINWNPFLIPEKKNWISPH